MELRRNGVDVEVFFLQGKGFLAYLKALFKLQAFLKKNQYDIVHAHYGYSGLIAGLISKYPVIVTYHGTDITEKTSNVISFFSTLFAHWNIFVTQKLLDKTIRRPKGNFSIIPCGVDLDSFYPIEKTIATKNLKWTEERTRILFSSSFSNEIKNSGLARKSLEKIKGYQFDFIEIKDKTRQEVAWMLNACDLLLLTSYSEGSPQIIKEAMACNCPIVATNVGDIEEVILGTKNSFVTDFDLDEIASKISLILDRKERSDGFLNIAKYNNKGIAGQIVKVYNGLLQNSATE